MAVDDHVAENQRRFRLANERIDQARTELAFEGDRVPFLCECPDPGCTSVIPLIPAEYAAVRAEDGHYVLLGEHVPEGETVVTQADGYVVARKDVEG